MTEESTPEPTDREVGAQIETPARKNPTEVPSRAAQVKIIIGTPRQVLSLRA
jgi:hypothetical protein